MKKKIILNLPYLIAGYVGTKMTYAYRIADGTAFAEKLKNIGAAFDISFAHPLPSLHPTDVVMGALMGAGL